MNGAFGSRTTAGQRKFLELYTIRPGIPLAHAFSDLSVLLGRFAPHRGTRPLLQPNSKSYETSPQPIWSSLINDRNRAGDTLEPGSDHHWSPWEVPS